MSSKTTYPFLKVHGSGNDFLLFQVDPRKDNGLFHRIPELCDRHTGIGADGAIFLWKDPSRGWEWRFFNADQSETDLCGNAARCVGMFLKEQEPTLKEWNWQGTLGTFKARCFDNWVEVTWPQKNFKSRTVPETLLEVLTGFNDFGLASVQLWDVGVPHLVLINHEAWMHEQRIGVNSMLRYSPDVGPEGANVTWVSLKTQEAVTFERGVEDETLACGSGAIAAFLSVNEHKKQGEDIPELKEFTFKFPGGDLKVRRDNGLWLSGQTAIVFQGELI